MNEKENTRNEISENENDADELTNSELESDLLEATTIISETLVTIDNNLHTCMNLLLIADVLLALIIGVICASIFSKFFKH